MDFRQPISYLFPAIIITMAGVLVFKIYKKGKGRIRFSCILFIIYIEILMQTAFFSREPGSRQQIDLNLFGTWGQTAIAHAYFIENKEHRDMIHQLIRVRFKNKENDENKLRKFIQANSGALE